MTTPPDAGPGAVSKADRPATGATATISPAARRGRRMLGLTVIATLAAMPFGDPNDHVQSTLRIVLLAVALGGYAGVLVTQARALFLTRRAVMGAAAVLTVAAVALPPQGSKDIWSYVMYGRTVSQWHESPYRYAPYSFPTDPVVYRVGHHWRHTPSVYGPVFVAVSAVGTSLAGDSLLADRLYFQALAALSLAACLALLGRATRGDPGALAFVALNPLVTATIVNGAHNDLFVGAATIAAVVLARERRPGWAGAVAGLGALVKLTGFVALLPLCLWLWHRQGLRAALRAGVAAVATVAGAYALVGGAVAVRPVLGAAGRTSRSSLWSVIEHLSPALRHPVVPLLAGALTLGVIVLAWRTRDLPVVTGVCVVAYLFTAPYVLPWYVGWALPVLALAWRHRLAVLGLGYGAAFLLAYSDGAHLYRTSLDHVLQTVSNTALLGLEALAVVVLLASAVATVTRRARGAGSLEPQPA